MGTKLANISFMNQTFSLFITLLPMCIERERAGYVDRTTNTNLPAIQLSELPHLF